MTERLPCPKFHEEKAFFERCSLSPDDTDEGLCIIAVD
jgi:hypothetical protein